MTSDEHDFLETTDGTRTQSWLASQYLATQTALRQHTGRLAIRQRVEGLLSAATMDIPITSCGRSLFICRPSQHELPQCCWQDGNCGKLEVLASATVRGGRNVTPVPLALSSDGQRAAIGWRTDCRDELEMQIVELKTRRVLSLSIPPFETHRTVWDSGLHGYWYVRRTGGQLQLLYQSIDEPEANPVLVHDALPAPRASDVSLFPFQDSTTLFLAVRSGSARLLFDYYILSLNPGSELQLLWREWPHKLSCCAAGKHLFILTDENAHNMRVLRVDLTNPTACTPDVLVPEGPHPITSMHLAGDLLLLRIASTPWTTELRAYSLDGKVRNMKGLPVDGTIEAIQAEIGGPHAYVEESGIGRRPSIYRLDTRTGEAVPTFQVFSRLTLPPIETVTTWYESLDGTRVPIRVSRRSDLPTGSPQPAMLTAYGGFGVVDSKRYTNRSALWLSLGGIYVHAGVRGGGELGAPWHSAGKLRQKPNTFADFIAAAEWLIAEGYTSADQLAIVGGSNAGLVVAVAMTKRPELFAAVICSGPILDMLRYHKFAGGTIGLSEFGSPDNPEDAAILRSYSPYHNVREGVNYPPALFVSGDSDTRCDPMHVRKMVARMQAANPGGKPVLLDYRPNKGHSGLMPLPDRIDALTNQFVFLAKSLRLHVNDGGMFERYCNETKTPS